MQIIIDKVKCEAKLGETLLTIARRNNIHIPTLCHLDALAGQGNCRMCMVEVSEGKTKKMVASCIYPVTKSIEVITNSEALTTMTGAAAQDPRQFTVSKENLPSDVVWPGAIFNILLISSVKVCEALIWHAVPSQTFMIYRPLGFRLRAL
jgi:hypothetical protein